MKKVRITLMLAAVAAIVITLFSQGTLAYYTTTGIATNVVTTGGVRLVIHETTTGGAPYPSGGVYVIPGQVITKRVTVENDCAHPFYLRVKLVNGINDAELSADDCLEVNLNTTDWTLRDDGYIYFNRALQPGEYTNPVFTEVKIVGERVDNSYIGKMLSLTVNAYAVQEEHNPAEHPWDAVGWPAD